MPRLGAVHLYTLTACLQQRARTSLKLLSHTASRISSPFMGTINVSSLVPRSISLVTVSLNPFHEIKNPSEHLALRFSILLLKSTNSFFPHLDVQFLHSTRRSALSLLKRGSVLSLIISMSISSVSVRIRPETLNPSTVSISRLTSSSSERPSRQLTRLVLRCSQDRPKAESPSRRPVAPQLRREVQAHAISGLRFHAVRG